MFERSFASAESNELSCTGCDLKGQAISSSGQHGSLSVESEILRLDSLYLDFALN
jgi:hypothetical protein